MAERYHRDFRSFWPYYVSQHMRRGTRALHYAGTWLALLGVGAALAGRWWLAPLGIAAAYGLAWLSHAAIERNRPASFVYPAYSFAGDLVLFWRISTGRIGRDVQLVAQRLAEGWAVDAHGFYPPEVARARGIVTDRRLVSWAAGA